MNNFWSPVHTSLTALPSHNEWIQVTYKTVPAKRASHLNNQQYYLVFPADIFASINALYPRQLFVFFFGPAIVNSQSDLLLLDSNAFCAQKFLSRPWLLFADFCKFKSTRIIRKSTFCIGLILLNSRKFYQTLSLFQRGEIQASWRIRPLHHLLTYKSKAFR